MSRKHPKNTRQRIAQYLDDYSLTDIVFGLRDEYLHWCNWETKDRQTLYRYIEELPTYVNLDRLREGMDDRRGGPPTVDEWSR